MSLPNNLDVNGDSGLNDGQDEQHVVYSSSILFEKQPAEAMEALVIRRQQAKLINKELAEWFTSYGRLRLHYVDELKKIHKRGEQLFTESTPALQTSKLDALGLCSPLWSDVLKILDDEINLFDQSTRKMGRDMIAPLRLFTRNNDSNLVEMDELIELATNLKSSESKGGNSTVYEEEWSRKAPYFFEIFENYDYQRLLLLKDVFSKYQTDVGDVIAHFKKDNENGLEHVLNFNVDDEITRFSQDVISKSLPIENIKLDTVQKSRTSTDGFTASAAAIATSSVVNSKRHSSLLSPHFHIKKTSERENNVPSNGTSNLNSNSSQASSVINKRLSSNTSMLSSSTLGASDDKKKDKHKMRSKFGSIFKGRKKNGKEPMYAPPSTIHEPDNSSINTATTDGSHNPNNRQRNHSIASNITRSQASVAHYPTTERTNPVQRNVEMSPISDSKRNSHPYSQSLDYPENRQESKPLPMYPLSAQPESQQLKEEKEKQEIISEPSSQSTQLVQPIQPVQPVQPVVEKQDSDLSLYQPMRPTKRSDSLSGSSVPPTTSLSTPSVTSASTSTPPVTSTSATSAIPSSSREMDDIPEATPVNSTNLSSPPPPPPSSRKHIATDIVTHSSLARQPHGSAPVPPTQRRSVLLDQQQPLQPAATGLQQPESLSKNTTGGGGLTGGQIMHPSLTTPGLNTSIVELFNASFKDGSLVRSNAIGEIAFSFIVDEDSKKLPSEISLQILSKSGKTLPNFMVNTMFLQESSTTPGYFTIADPSQISMRTVGGLKYMLNSPTPPIIVTPIWKHEDKQSTVIISIKPTTALESFLSTDSMIISNVMISVSIQGAIVSSAATKPSGSLNREKGRVTWALTNPIVFNSSKKEERFVARFITNQKATESESGVQIRFNMSNEDGAGRIDFLNTDMKIKARGENIVEDPFGDGSSKQTSDWSDVPTLKSLVAGSYSGHT